MMTSCEASVDDDCTIDVATCSKQFLKGTEQFPEREQGIRKNGPIIYQQRQREADIPHYRLHHTPPYEMMKQKELQRTYIAR
uniref:Uncharacterized protein n=1 Tax=Oryza nivara TaxID=4536 RepID=A0A0E0I7A4_ORYNI